MTVTYHIELPDQIAAVIEASAQAHNVTAENLVSEAVLEYLEDQQDAQLVAVRLRSDARYYTSEEVIKCLGL